MPGRQWDNTWKASQDAITAAQASIRSHSRTRLPVQRINILEASVLDSEIYSLLEMSFATVLGSARALEQSAGPTPTWRRLLGLGIRLAVTGATIMIDLRLPGQILQSVRYRNERLFQDARTRGVLRLPNDGPTRTQRGLWMFLTVVMPYCWSSVRYRLTIWFGGMLRSYRNSNLTSDTLDPPEEVVGKWIDVLEAAWGFASLANLMFFFQNGVYTSLEDRVLQMRQVPLRGGGARMLNFDFQNRQIVFNELNDFAIYMLPMLRVYSTLRAGRRMGARLSGRMKRLGRHVGMLPPKEASATVVKRDKDGTVVVEDCSYCGESPASMPHITSCGCTMCFYCLRTHLDPLVSAAGHIEGACPSCGQRMRWSKRWEDMFGVGEEVEVELERVNVEDAGIKCINYSTT